MLYGVVWLSPVMSIGAWKTPTSKKVLKRLLNLKTLYQLSWCIPKITNHLTNVGFLLTKYLSIKGSSGKIKTFFFLKFLTVFQLFSLVLLTFTDYPAHYDVRCST